MVFISHYSQNKINLEGVDTHDWNDATSEGEPSKMTTRRIRTVSGQSDIASGIGRKPANDVTQLGNDHYMIRRRGTKIFVKGFPQMDRLKALNDGAIAEQGEDPEPGNDDSQRNLNASWLFSGIYAMHIVIITLVFKITQFITTDITAAVIDSYFIFLYCVSLLWTVACRPLATACYQHKARVGFAKSNHVNNRWLKGVLFTFGIAIIIKDGLEFIALVGIDSPQCENKALYSSVPVIHAVFIVCQVNFLFQYSKVFIQDYQVLSRFGVMHVIATNLAIWIATIADETAHALSEPHAEEAISPNDPHSVMLASADLVVIGQPTYQPYSGYRSVSPARAQGAKGLEGDVMYFGNCTCNQTFCSAIAVAEAFLFPFVIEFSLVACCLLYVTWRNIGKAPHVCQHIVKPSYKLYRSYKGVISGTVTFFACVMVLVVLGTDSSELPSEKRSYFTEHEFLLIYNIFLLVLEIFMAAACFFGFYLFNKNSHGLKSDEEDLLDAVLLMICLLGPILVGVFSILANIVGHENKAVPGWFLNILQPICDIFQCLVQVMFILYGIKREPATSQDCQETAAEVHRHVRNATGLSVAEYDQEFESGFDEPASNFFALRKGAASNFATPHDTPVAMRPAAVFAASLAGLNGPVSGGQQPKSLGFSVEDCGRQREQNGTASGQSKGEADGASSEESNKGGENNNDSKSDPDQCGSVSSSEGFEFSTPVSRQVREISSVNELTPSNRKRHRTQSIAFDNAIFIEDEQESECDGPTAPNPFPASSQHKVKIVSETRVSDPDRSRLLLRNVVLFLLIANACLWAFWSLEGTVFVVYTYQYSYYTESAWTTIAMICRPLSIFFRMHSAACLFEIWSFS